MPYILKTNKQIDVLRLLVEGNSISGTARITGVHRDTCTRLMHRFGVGCQKFLDRELRDLNIAHVQLDEIWTFCRKKRYRLTDAEKKLPDVGDIFIYVAFDEATRLVPAHLVGKRDRRTTELFIKDLFERMQLPKPHASDGHCFQEGQYKPITRISTDGYKEYRPAIESIFGPYAEHGLLVKKVSGRGKNKKVEITKHIISGEIADKDVTTSLVERNNLTIRTFMKRLNRKSLGFSKRLENLSAATALHFTYYNYCWVHKTLKTTPAVAAGVVGKRWNLVDLYEHIRDTWPDLFFG